MPKAPNGGILGCVGRKGGREKRMGEVNSWRRVFYEAVLEESVCRSGKCSRLGQMVRSQKKREGGKERD